MGDVLARGYDLNEGIIVQYNEQIYHGVDAMHFLALMSSQHDFFNQLNAFIFKRKKLAYLLYPLLKSLRQFLLWVRRIDVIERPASKSFIERIFPGQTSSIPSVLCRRYMNRSFSNDSLRLEGSLTITLSTLFKVVSPLFRLVGALVPYSGEHVKTTVEIVSDINSPIITMKRTLDYPSRQPVSFISKVEYLQKQVVIERMHVGLCARLNYRYEDGLIRMEYGGYVLKLGRLCLRLPLGLILGCFYGEERAIHDQHFEMDLVLKHALFGQLFRYAGMFKIN